MLPLLPFTTTVLPLLILFITPLPLLPLIHHNEYYYPSTFHHYPSTTTIIYIICFMFVHGLFTCSLCILLLLGSNWPMTYSYAEISLARLQRWDGSLGAVSA